MATPIVESVALTDASGSSGSDYNVNLPAGIVAGDLILCALSINNATSTPVTIPSGYSLLYSEVSETFITGVVFYKVAGGSEGSQAAVGFNAANQAVARSYRISGFSGSISYEASSIGNSTTNLPPPITPSGGASDYLYLVFDHIDTYTANVTGYPSGYINTGTEQSATGAACRIAWGEKPTTSTSSETPTAFTLSATRRTVVSTIAIPSESGSGGNDVILDIDSGSFALSGSDLLLRASRLENLSAGSYNLSGSNIALSVSYAITLDSGMYSLSGSSTGLVLNANSKIESGEYLLTGTQVNLDIARKSIIENGSYNLTGSDVTLIYIPSGGGKVLSIDSGTFSLSGSDIELKAARLISLNAGNYNLAGQSVALTYNAKTIIDGGSYALTGSNINLFANRVIIASSGSYTLSGTSVILKYSGDTYKTIGTVTAGFAQDRYSAEYKPTTITVNFKD